MAKKKIDPKIQAWITARDRHHLSHAHVQMARELGMNPAKLGKIDNHRQELWKAPLPEFIEHLYEKRFGKTRPEVVRSLEERARASAVKDAEHQATKRARRAARVAGEATGASVERMTDAKAQSPSHHDGGEPSPDVVLTDGEFARMATILENPPAPSARLRTLLRR